MSAAAPLRAALDEALDGWAQRQVGRAVERLIGQYRGEGAPAAFSTPVLRDPLDAAAYAAYRMPATFEAVRCALAALAQALPADWAPRAHLDLGGGTGAATWAVSATWPGERPVTVLDWAEPALALGRELAARNPGLRSVRWRRGRITEASPGAEGPLMSHASTLSTLSYVLAELTEQDRGTVVDAAVRAGRVVVIVEPGTPDGYARVLAARERLTAAGWRVAAPCPHSAACPIAPGTDWCHFSARVSRSALHRRVKGGSLPYEDEKFSYVAAVHPDVPLARTAAARVLRKPQIRKGHVLLDLCTADATLTPATVAKRHGTAYRAARDVAWGDPWEPTG